VAMQNGMLFLHAEQTSSVSAKMTSQYGHGDVGSSSSDLSGFLHTTTTVLVLVVVAVVVVPKYGTSTCGVIGPHVATTLQVVSASTQCNPVLVTYCALSACRHLIP